MPDNLMIPSVDLRVGALEEYNRRQKDKAEGKAQKARPRPCITLSREFGCEGYPVAERLAELMAARCGEPWLVIDKAVLDEVAQRHNVSAEVLRSLGDKNRLLNEVLATFSSRWKTDHEHFQLLCRHVLSLAEQGNVIIVELGGAVIGRSLEQVFNFRLYAPLPFKIATVARRLGVDNGEAEEVIHREQRKRDRFLTDFLGHNGHDPALYDVMFNNGSIPAERIAAAIADFVGST